MWRVIFHRKGIIMPSWMRGEEDEWVTVAAVYFIVFSPLCAHFLGRSFIEPPVASLSVGSLGFLAFYIYILLNNRKRACARSTGCISSRVQYCFRAKLSRARITIRNTSARTNNLGADGKKRRTRPRGKRSEKLSRRHMWSETVENSHTVTLCQSDKTSDRKMMTRAYYICAHVMDRPIAASIWFGRWPSIKCPGKLFSLSTFRAQWSTLRFLPKFSSPIIYSCVFTRRIRLPSGCWHIFRFHLYLSWSDG